MDDDTPTANERARIVLALFDRETTCLGCGRTIQPHNWEQRTHGFYCQNRAGREMRQRALNARAVTVRQQGTDA